MSSMNIDRLSQRKAPMSPKARLVVDYLSDLQRDLREGGNPNITLFLTNSKGRLSVEFHYAKTEKKFLRRTKKDIHVSSAALKVALTSSGDAISSVSLKFAAAARPINPDIEIEYEALFTYVTQGAPGKVKMKDVTPAHHQPAKTGLFQRAMGWVKQRPTMPVNAL